MQEDVIPVRSKMKRWVAVSSLLLLSVLLPLAVVAQVALASWPVAHFDNARTNFNSNEFLLGPLTSASLPSCGASPRARGPTTCRPSPTAWPTSRLNASSDPTATTSPYSR